MNFKIILAAVSLAVALISCEKVPLKSEVFVPNVPDTTQVSGAKMSFSINGAASFSYFSKGFGSLCPNTVMPGTFVWLLATGNNLQYDPVTQDYDLDINDTTFALAWIANVSSPGIYSVPNPLTEADCFMVTPSFIRFYDPSQITVNITSVTTDSIFGTYSGSLPELIDVQFDPTTGAPIPFYSGVVDSVATTFKVQRNPC